MEYSCIHIVKGIHTPTKLHNSQQCHNTSGICTLLIPVCR